MALSALPIVTLIVFAILVHPILFCLWKHGRPGILGWMVLQVFCFIRIVGSILQLQEEATHSTSSVSLLINNIGLSPLFLGVAGVLHEARTSRNPNMNTKIEWVKVLSFHAAVILSMVFVILGVVKELSETDPKSNGLVKVGVILLLLCWITLSAWIILSFSQPKQSTTEVPAWEDATLLLYAVLAVLPFIGVRNIYAILTAFLSNPNFKNNTAAKVFLSVIPEMAVVLFMAVVGIRTRNIASLRKTSKVEQASAASEA